MRKHLILLFTVISLISYRHLAFGQVTYTTSPAVGSETNCPTSDLNCALVSGPNNLLYQDNTIEIRVTSINGDQVGLRIKKCDNSAFQNPGHINFREDICDDYLSSNVNSQQISFNAGATQINVTVTLSSGFTNGCVSLSCAMQVYTSPYQQFYTPPVQICAVPPPGTPSNPTAPTSNCGSATLTRGGTPPSGVTWYWQGTSCGTSTSLGSGTTYTATSSGTYYIRARNNSTLAWSTGCGSKTVTVTPTPSVTANSNSPITAGATLNLTANTISNASYSWTGPNGYTSTSEDPSRANSTTAMSGQYCVTATVNGCVGNTDCESVTVNAAAPGTPANPTAPTANCGSATITRTGNPPSGVVWYWQGASCGTSTSLGSGSTYTVTSSNTYHIRAYDTNTGLWSSGCGSVAVNVTPVPAVTANSNSPITAGATLNLTANTISNASYNWTGPSGYTSTSEDPSRANSTTAMSGQYCVIATVNGCASNQSCVSVTVNAAAPGTPANPTAPTANCGSATITRTGNPPSGVVWYWQGASCGTSTSLGSGSTYTVTSSNTYHIRAYDTNTGLWSSGCGSVAVNVTPVPAVTANSNSPITAGATLNLTANTISNASYNWTGPSGYTSTSEDPSRANSTTAMSGQYCVIATVNGCASNQSCVSVTVSPLTLSCNGCESVRLLTPLANATEMPLSAILTWEHTFGRGIQSYGVTVKPILGGVPGAALSLPSSSNIAVPSSGQKLSYAVPGINYLTYGQQYEWEVYAYGANGQPISCGNRRFTVVAQPNVSLPSPEPFSAGTEYYGAHIGHMNNTLIKLTGNPYTPGSTNANAAARFPNNGEFVCDELTRRFYQKQFGIDVRWDVGFARETRFDYDHWSREGIQFFVNGLSPFPPQVGDMLVYHKVNADGSVLRSHVAIVSAVGNNSINVKQQNSRRYVNDFSGELRLDAHRGATSFNLSQSNGFWTINDDAIVGWRRAEPTIVGPGLSSSIPSLSPGSSLIFEILPSFSINNQNSSWPTYAQAATLYVNKYNPTTNCYETLGNKSFSSLDPYTINNGVAGFQLPRGNTYQYRWLINYTAGGVWSEAYYFTISASNSSPLVNVGFSAVNVPEFLNVSNYSSLLAGAEHMQRVGNDWISVGTSNGYGNSSIWSMTGYQVGDSLLTEAPGYEQIRFSLSPDELTRKHMNIPMLSSITNASDIIKPQVELVTPSLPIASSGTFTFKVTAQNLDGFYVAQQDDDSDTYPIFTPSDTIVTLTALDTGITNFKFVMYHGNDTIEVNKQVCVGADMHMATLNSDASSSGSRVYWNSEFIGILSNSLNIAVPKFASNYLNVRKFGFEEQTFKISSDSIINVSLILRPDFSATETTFSVNPFGRPVYTKDISAQSIGGAPFTIGISRSLVDFVPRALDNASQTFRFRNTSGGSGTIRFASILDQVQSLSPNDIYMFVEYPTQSVKLNLDSLSGIGGYDSLVQKLFFNSFEILEGDGRVTLIRKQAPISIGSLVTGSEDQPFSISLYDLFADPDSIPDDMTFAVNGTGSGITAQLVGDSIVITPDYQFNGNSDFTITATHDWLTVTQTVQVDVSPVNDAPVVSELQPVQLCSGAAANVNFASFLTDADNAVVDLSVSVTVTAVNNPNYTTSDLVVTTIGQVSTLSTAIPTGAIFTIAVSANDGQANSNVRTVQVTVQPPVIVSILPENAVQCNGQPLQLWGTGADSYAWGYTIPNIGYIGIAATDTFTFSTIPTGTVTLTGTTGNCQGSASYTLASANGPVVSLESGTTELCLGDSTIITASGATQYQWQSDQPFAINSTNQIWAHPTADATYISTGTDGSGCEGTATLAIEVNDIPIAPVISNAGGPLESSYSNGNQWYLNGQPLIDETGQQLTNPLPGVYTVEHTDANGCTSMSESYEVLEIVTGVDNGGMIGRIDIIPNPNLGQFDLVMSNPSANSTYQLFDMLGQLLQEGTITSGRTTINIPQAAEGVYFIEVRSETSVRRNRIVKL